MPYPGSAFYPSATTPPGTQGTVGAPTVPYLAATVALVPRGVGALTATPFTTLALPTLTVRAIRNDGLTGTAVAVGYLPFAPGAVHPADVAQYRLYDGTDTEVASYITDEGARHSDGSVLYARAQVADTWTNANTHPVYTARADRGTGVARRTASAYSALLAAANAPTLAPDGTTPAKIALTNTGFWYSHLDDTVRRWAAGAVTWANPYAVARQAGGRVGLGAVLYLSNQPSDPPLLYVHDTAIENGNVYNFGDQYSANGRTARPVVTGLANYTPVADVAIMLAAGSGTFTMGTTSLNDPMVSQIIVFSLAPTRVPIATLTPTDPATLTAARFVPWDLPTTTAAAAVSSTYATVETQSFAAADTMYSWRGPQGPTFTQSQNTTYAPSMLAWSLFAQGGRLRDLRRAHVYYEAWASYCRANPAAGNQGVFAGKWRANANEAMCDTTMCPFAYQLTGDDEALTRIDDVLQWAEALAYSSQPSNTTQRPMMRVAQGLVMLHRLGIRTGAGFVLPDNTYQQYGTATTAIGTAARWARLVTQLRAGVVAGTGINSARRYLYQYGSDYGLSGGSAAPGAGCTPFLLFWIASWASIAQRVIARDIALDTDLRDMVDYAFTARKQDDSDYEVYNATVGHERFYYATINRALVGAEGDGMAFVALDYLARTADPSRAALWRSRGDTLYAPLATDADHTYFGKQESEARSFSASWPLVRTA